MDHAAAVQSVCCPQAGAIRSEGSKGAAIGEFFAMVTRCLTIAMGFAIPISTAVTSALSIMLVVCWVFSGGYATKLRTIRQNKVALLALAMFGLYAGGLAYSSAPFSEAAATLLTYRKYLYIAVLVTVFAHAQARDYSIRAFELAMLITLGASFLMSWGFLQSKWGTLSDCAVFKSHISQNTLMAFLVAVLAHRACLSSRLRWLYVGVILLACYNIFFMVGGRTGYVIVFALVCWFMFQWKGLRGFVLAIALVASLGAAAYACSSVFQERVDKAIQETADYYYYQRDSTDSSIGRRLTFYRTSALIALRHPVFGTGTGSFRHEFDRLAENRGKPTAFYPHNEYFSVLVQTGLLGLSLFLYWLYAHWAASKQLRPELAFLAQALLVTFAVGSLFNSVMSQTTLGHLHCYFAGLCYAGLSQGTVGSRDGRTRSDPHQAPLRQETRPGKRVPCEV